MLHKFTIAIPAFKTDFLKECVQSILDQSYEEFELIVLNDCSPYGVADIIKGFNDPRISYIENEVNVGAKDLVLNWNRCLELSSAEFIIIMGDDDRLDPDYLKEFLSLIQRYPDLDVYHCRSKIIDSNGIPKSLTPSWPEYETTYDNIWHRITERRLQYVSDFVYRREALIKNSGFVYAPLAWGSDDLTSYKLAGAKGIAHTNRPVFNYRSHGSSITSTGNLELKQIANNLYLRWIEEFLVKEPSDSTNKVLFNDLKLNYKKYLSKRNRNALTKSLNGNLRYCFILFKCYKKHGLKLSDAIYILLNGIRKFLIKAT